MVCNFFLSLCFPTLLSGLLQNKSFNFEEIHFINCFSFIEQAFDVMIKNFTKPKVPKIFPLLYSESFALYFNLWPIWNEFFAWSMRFRLRFFLGFFCLWISNCSTLSIEKTILPPLNYFCNCVKNQLAVIGNYLRACHCVPWCVPILPLHTTNYIVFKISVSTRSLQIYRNETEFLYVDLIYPTILLNLLFSCRHLGTLFVYCIFLCIF